jgi:hypothetical protein
MKKTKRELFINIIAPLGVLVTIIVGGFIAYQWSKISRAADVVDVPIAATVTPEPSQSFRAAQDYGDLPQEAIDMIEEIESGYFYSTGYLDVTGLDWGEGGMVLAILGPTPPPGLDQEYMNAVFLQMLEHILRGTCLYDLYNYSMLLQMPKALVNSMCAGDIAFMQVTDAIQVEPGLDYIELDSLPHREFFKYLGRFNSD